jgi:hypothetical protein
MDVCFSEQTADFTVYRYIVYTVHMGIEKGYHTKYLKSLKGRWKRETMQVGKEANVR